MLAFVGKAALWTGKLVVKEVLVPVAITVALGFVLKSIADRLPPKPADPNQQVLDFAA
jgi:hypothetical protein